VLRRERGKREQRGERGERGAGGRGRERVKEWRKDDCWKEIFRV